MDPVHFPDPERFIPDRFVQPDGSFLNDPRVCVFSIGLRNCIGKQLAITGRVLHTKVIEHYNALTLV